MKKELSLILSVKSIFYVLLRPSKFHKFQENHIVPLGIPAADDTESINIIYRAFWGSLLLVAISASVGCIIGYFSKFLFGVANSTVTFWLQAVGAAILLWGTLFIRGWEIQTFEGETLIERINQWLYRSLYCLGTAIFMSSLTWSLK